MTSELNTTFNQKPHSRLHLIRSSFWVFGGQIGGQVLRFLNNLIMTRLLVPEMFGVMTVVSTVFFSIAMFSHIGIQQNIIQNPRGDEKRYLDTAWTLQILRCMVIWLVSLIVAYSLHLANQFHWLAPHSAYAAPDLPAILAVFSLIALISAFESTKTATASRHMALSRLTMIELGSQIVGIVVMILIALIERTIWALVAGNIVTTLSRVIAGFVFLPGHNNQLAWDKSAVKDLIGFGKWILLTTIMGFLVRNIDKLILGALITPTLLGIYNIAAFMITAIQEIFSKWVDAVVMPVLSRTQRENSAELSNKFYQFSYIFNTATLFFCGFLYNAGYILIAVLYDSRYQSAGYMVQVLSISLLGARMYLAQQIYLAMGKPKLLIPMNVIQLSALVVFLVPAYRYFGMAGALHVIASATLLTVPVTWCYLKKLGILNWKKELITLPALCVGYIFSDVCIYLYNIILSNIH